MKKSILAILIFVVLAAPAAFAKKGKAHKKRKAQKVEVIQRSRFVKWHRVELSVAASFGLNEVLTRHYGVTATFKYHITPHWAVRADYTKYFGWLSGTADDVIDQYQVFPEKRILDFYTGVGAEYTFFMGKFLAFNKAPFAWDFHMFATLGVTRNTYHSLHFTPGFGFGLRFAFYKCLTFNIEAGDFIYRESFMNGHKIFNNIQLMTGFSLFIPFTYHYKYPR